MSHTVGSVTILVGRLKAGSHTALAAITGRFLVRQERFAARLLGRSYPGSDGADDVAVLVLHRLWNLSQHSNKVQAHLTDSVSLMATLNMLTRQRVMQVTEYDRRAKRDIGRTIRDADCHELIAAREPDGADGGTHELTEGFTGRQKLIVELLHAGWIREELPAQLGCSLTTVRRELESIKVKLRS